MHPILAPPAFRPGMSSCITPRSTGDAGQRLRTRPVRLDEPAVPRGFCLLDPPTIVHAPSSRADDRASHPSGRSRRLLVRALSTTIVDDSHPVGKQVGPISRPPRPTTDGALRTRFYQRYLRGLRSRKFGGNAMQCSRSARGISTEKADRHGGTARRRHRSTGSDGGPVGVAHDGVQSIMFRPPKTPHLSTEPFSSLLLYLQNASRLQFL
jgi:hypothetical protein